MRHSYPKQHLLFENFGDCQFDIAVTIVDSERSLIENSCVREEAVTEINLNNISRAALLPLDCC